MSKFKVVPVEPTEAMLSVRDSDGDRPISGTGYWFESTAQAEQFFSRAYAAMLNAYTFDFDAAVGRFILAESRADPYMKDPMAGIRAGLKAALGMED